MDRIVLDTNVVVSAALNALGAPGRVLDLVLDGAVELAVSPAIIEEYRSVLARPRLALAPGRAELVVEGILGVALDVVPGQRIRVCSDPADDMFLECAFAAGAGFVVTGNLRHFPQLFAGIRIVAPAAFLRRFSDGKTPPP